MIKPVNFSPPTLMKKIYKFILSWNWAAIFWTVAAVFNLNTLANHIIIGASSNHIVWWSFGTVASITLICASVIDAVIKRAHEYHDIPPPGAICPSLPCEQIRHYQAQTDAVIFVTTTNSTLKKTGYYKCNADKKWVYIESFPKKYTH